VTNLAAVLNLQAAAPFPSDHDLSVTAAELDLTNRPASSVNLPENYPRDSPRIARTTRAQIAASPDLNSRWRGIEVGFEHRLVSLSRVPGPNCE
jgi:hypothetical protein